MLPDAVNLLQTKIKNNIDSPEILERLYRSDKKAFKKAFYVVYPEIAEHQVAIFWKARFEMDKPIETKATGRKTDVLFLVTTCLITGFLIKLPQLFNPQLEAYFFYEKNAGLIVFLGLLAYSFLSKDRINHKHLLLSVLVFVLSAVYINVLPSDSNSNSINLAYIHLPLMLWCLYGLVYIDFDIRYMVKRIDYIKYNGDLAILVAIILITGGVLTGVTLELFSAISLNIENFYFDYIVILGLVSAPIVATYIIRSFPSVTHKIAPIIASIFSPLVLITLVSFLIGIIFTGKDPYNDRDFLIVFNLMLLGVVAIVVFSVSELSVNKRKRFSEWTLFLLSVLALIVDLVALSAILYRLGEYGFTPNRTAVLGSNILIFGNLVLIMIDLFKVNFKKGDIKQVEHTIAGYLPIYTAWTIFMVFVIPFIFGFR